jgi:outer membrane biosynthesis protein TonB
MKTFAHKNRTAAKKYLSRKNIFRLALIFSVILHLFAFLLAGIFTIPITAISQQAAAAKEYRPPIVFTLAETPESARREKPPENARHFSDKNAAAQNPNAPKNLPVDQPFALGALREATTATQPQTNSSEPAEENKPVEKSEERFRPNDGFSSSFSRDFLTGGRSTPQQLLGNPEAGYDNQQSRSPEIGSFSLNTYEWDFAPYMLWLKKLVQRNIYPPPAFTRMGIISGRTVLRFRINRDGTLQGMELIGYQGHKSLMETSVRAVQLSAPFRSLPHDFPEDFLEVTGQFDYIVTR